MRKEDSKTVSAFEACSVYVSVTIHPEVKRLALDPGSSRVCASEIDRGHKFLPVTAEGHIFFLKIMLFEHRKGGRRVFMGRTGQAGGDEAGTLLPSPLGSAQRRKTWELSRDVPVTSRRGRHTRYT